MSIMWVFFHVLIVSHGWRPKPYEQSLPCFRWGTNHSTKHHLQSLLKWLCSCFMVAVSSHYRCSSTGFSTRSSSSSGVRRHTTWMHLLRCFRSPNSRLQLEHARMVSSISQRASTYWNSGVVSRTHMGEQHLQLYSPRTSGTYERAGAYCAADADHLLGYLGIQHHCKWYGHRLPQVRDSRFWPILHRLDPNPRSMRGRGPALVSNQSEDATDRRAYEVMASAYTQRRAWNRTQENTQRASSRR